MVSSDEIAAWRRFLTDVRDRPRSLAVKGLYCEICALVTGFALGRNDDVGRLFPGWVMARAGDRPELAEPSQILRLALGVDNPPGVTTVQGEESDRAVAMYMTLLEQFLDELAGSVDG